VRKALLTNLITISFVAAEHGPNQRKIKKGLLYEIYGVLNVWLAHCELFSKREKQKRNIFHLEYLKSLHK